MVFGMLRVYKLHFFKDNLHKYLDNLNDIAIMLYVLFEPDARIKTYLVS